MSRPALSPLSDPAVQPVQAGRRRFLARGVWLAGGAAGRSTALQAPTLLAPALLAPSAQARLADGLGEAGLLDAWPSVFADVPEGFGPTEVAWSRPLPDGFPEGTIYRNGPARMHRGPTRYRHWFDGDGMVQAFRLGPTALRHQGRMVRTEKYVAEEKAGRFLRAGFGTPIAADEGGGAGAGAGPDAGNVGNISVLPIKGESGPEVLALWEAGSPWRIQPDSLETLGIKQWSPETARAAFSAHPKVDRDGAIWSFGYLPGSGKLLLYRIDAGGQLRGVQMIETADADMVHDFAITDRWLVFVLMPLRFHSDPARGDGSFLSRLEWQDGRPGSVVLVDRQTLSLAHRFEIPATPFFHLGNAWDDGKAVRIQIMTIPGFDNTMAAIFAAMAGKGHATVGGGLAEIRVTIGRETGQVLPLSAAAAEFPTFDPRFIGTRSRSLFACGRSQAFPEEAFGFNTVARVDNDTGKTQVHDYGPATLAEEHLFLPRAGRGEGVGWLVGTAYDHGRGRTLVSVFDAEAVDAGPISQAVLPYGLPFGFHGAFVPARG